MYFTGYGTWPVIKRSDWFWIRSFPLSILIVWIKVKESNSYLAAGRYIYIYVCIYIYICVCVCVCVCVFIYTLPDINLMFRVFANGPGDLGSIPGWVIPKTQKMVLDATLLNAQHYKVRIKIKWSNPGKEVEPSPTPWCSSYRKWSLLVTLDYGD